MTTRLPLTTEAARLLGQMFAEESALVEEVVGPWTGTLDDALQVVPLGPPEAERVRLAKVLHAAAAARWAELVREAKVTSARPLAPPPATRPAPGTVVKTKVGFTHPLTGAVSLDPWWVHEVTREQTTIRRVYPFLPIFGCRDAELRIPAEKLSCLRHWDAS